jgi:Zn-dependent M28 family amino/carboxypeptidase
MIRYLLLPALLFSVLTNIAFSQATHFDGNTWWGHVKVLADDKMEGRETGSEGLKNAESYVVDQLKAAGLQPAGTKGYYQPVKFVSREIVENDSSAALVRNGKAQSLVLGEDAIFSTRVDLAPHTEAPLVFVGYGLNIPENKYNDLAGLDLKGKVAVLLTGSPADVPSALSAHYQSTAVRWKALREAGVIGVISIPNPSSMDIPWSRIAANRAHPSMALADPKLDETAGEKFAMYFNPAKAEALFEGSGHTFQEIADLGKDRKPMPHFELPVSIKATTKMNVKQVTSSNIVAKLPGNDPKMKDSYVVLSAHVDHVGIGQPINGDKIYNGAMDNASGTAVLMDVAAELKKSHEKLKRSLLFVIVTGEEKGLLGSQYFAEYPTVEPKSMVADINIDMFLPIVPLKVLTVYGLAESDLGDDARAAAEKEGVRVQPDPQPLRNVFIRSDQYNFIKKGIPALAMDVSFDPGSPEQEIFKKWRTDRYHAPSDDLQQPVDLQTAAKYEEIVRDLMIKTANDDQRPQWKSDSFFRRYAGGE